jgi:hypothetical protein
MDTLKQYHQYLIDESSVLTSYHVTSKRLFGRLFGQDFPKDTKLEVSDDSGSVLRMVGEKKVNLVKIDDANRVVFLSNTRQYTSNSKLKSLQLAVRTACEYAGFGCVEVLSIPEDASNVKELIMSALSKEFYTLINALRSGNDNSNWKGLNLAVSLSGKSWQDINNRYSHSKYPDHEERASLALKEAIEEFNPGKRVRDLFSRLQDRGYYTEVEMVKAEILEKGNLLDIQKRCEKDKKIVNERHPIDISPERKQELINISEERAAKYSYSSVDWILERLVKQETSYKKKLRASERKRLDVKFIVESLVYQAFKGLSEEDHKNSMKYKKDAAALYLMLGGTGPTKKYSGVGYEIAELFRVSQNNPEDLLLFLTSQNKLISAVASGKLKEA